MICDIKFMIGSGGVSHPTGEHVVQQTRLTVGGMFRRRFVLILVTGMMKDQTDLIDFSSKEGLMGAVHQHRNEGEPLSASDPDRQIYR